MISVKLLGGLGNQMFQYAIGRNLALKNNTGLNLDLSMLRKWGDQISHTVREFELDIFNITYTSKKDVNDKPRTLKKIIRKLLSIKVINETNFFFDPEVLNKRGNVLLNGFWQSELYFKEIEDIIRKEFRFKYGPDAKNQEMLNRIDKLNAVSLHVRRGDYITNAIASDFHGICSHSYYINAVEYINQRIKNTHFFIFSDDKEWVKNNFKVNSPFTVVDINNGLKSYEDMRLMSHCKHHIIANSSFSWWGAWLNENPNKIVIGPVKWFKTLETDIIPNNWIKLEN